MSRRLGTIALAALAMVTLTLLLTALRRHVNLTGDVTIYLLLVVLVSLSGGFWVAIVTAVVSVLVLNYYFSPPLHSLTVFDSDAIVDLVVFGVVAVIVSRLVHMVARRTVQASRASQRASTLAGYGRQRAALLNAVSHDLRAPLARAKAAVSSLQAEDVQWSPADRDELLAAADTSLDRLTDLVEDLLDVSRLQAGAVSVLARPTGLDEVVAGALDHVATPVLVQIPDDLPAAEVDAALLERVIANLLENAARYSPIVELAARADEHQIELRVIDHGPGIADAAHLFEPFQRTDDAPVNGAGVGLGLAIARGFTEAMGGHIATTTTPGGGATFVVTLPRARE